MQTVLVVDDERVIREGCTRLLKPEGFAVLTAETGREALDLLSTEPADVILCDLLMPVMGAFEVIEEVRVHYPDLPLIVITGHGTVATAVEAMRKGAYDFITKPFAADHLILIVKRALEKRELEKCARSLQENQVRNLYDLSVEKSRIRTITNCMADGVLVTNRYLEIVLHNPALMRLFGFPESLPEPCELPGDIAAENLKKDLKAILDSRCEEGGQISREFCLGDKYINAVSAPIPGMDNQIVGTVTLFKDVSVYKQLSEIKSNFVQLVSHELRSPLASIEQLLAVVLEGLAGELTEKQKDLLSRSQLKIRDLLELIADLLDVARIESGKELQQRTPVDLPEVLDHIFKLVKPRAEGQKILLRLEIRGELPLVEADPRCMEELFSNLISNAINYSPDGGEVVVSAVPNGNFLQVRVSDNGVGIEPEEISKIFDKFYRIKNPRTRHIRGSGLGLSIVKRIVESHGGSVEVESMPGSGTTFRVLLPALSSLSTGLSTSNVSGGQE